MAKIDVVCPRCSETQGVIRNGHSTSGAQLYRCKLCLKTFQLSFQYNAAKPDTHQSII
ncbi:IS1 family transposase, partial [Klebsiella pneumoniae]|nr:IS1 family transposase [Klebsiella pneumoniae]